MSPLLILFIFMFTSVNIYLDKNGYDDSYVGRIVSMFHNIPTALFGTYVIFNEDLKADRINYTNDLSEIMCTLSVAFFTWDLIWQVTKKKKEQQYIIHGLVGLVMNLFTYYTGTFHYYAGLLLIWEYTSIPLFYCWYCVHEGLTKRLSFKITSGILIMSHFLLRVFMSTYVYFSQFIYEESGFILKIVVLPLIGLQYMWMWKLIEKALAIF